MCEQECHPFCSEHPPAPSMLPLSWERVGWQGLALQQNSYSLIIFK